MTSAARFPQPAANVRRDHPTIAVVWCPTIDHPSRAVRAVPSASLHRRVGDRSQLAGLVGIFLSLFLVPDTNVFVQETSSLSFRQRSPESLTS